MSLVGFFNAWEAARLREMSLEASFPFIYAPPLCTLDRITSATIQPLCRRTPGRECDATAPSTTVTRDSCRIALIPTPANDAEMVGVLTPQELQCARHDEARSDDLLSLLLPAQIIEAVKSSDVGSLCSAEAFQVR